jgi:hypothetical protein
MSFYYGTGTKDDPIMFYDDDDDRVNDANDVDADDADVSSGEAETEAYSCGDDDDDDDDGSEDSDSNSVSSSSPTPTPPPPNTSFPWFRQWEEINSSSSSSSFLPTPESKTYKIEGIFTARPIEFTQTIEIDRSVTTEWIDGEGNNCKDNTNFKVADVGQMLVENNEQLEKIRRDQIQIGNLKNEKDELVDRVDRQSGYCRQKEGEIQVLNNILDQREDEIDKQDAELELRKNVIFKMAADIVKGRKDVKETEKQIVELKETVAEKDKEIVKANETVAEKDKQIAELKETVAEKDKQIAELLKYDTYTQLIFRNPNPDVLFHLMFAIRESESFLDKMKLLFNASPKLHRLTTHPNITSFFRKHHELVEKKRQEDAEREMEKEKGDDE